MRLFDGGYVKKNPSGTEYKSQGGDYPAGGEKFTIGGDRE